MSYPITTLKNVSVDELVNETVKGTTLRAKVRKMIYHGVAAIEQAQQQRRAPSIIEIRRMEMQLADNVIEFIKKAQAAPQTSNRLSTDQGDPMSRGMPGHPDNDMGM